MSQSLWVPQQLKDARQRVEAGEKCDVSVREFLGWFNCARRGSNVVSGIRKTLEQCGLTTKPDFAYAWLDSKVTIDKREGSLLSVSGTPPISISSSLTGIEGTGTGTYVGSSSGNTSEAFIAIPSAPLRLPEKSIEATGGDAPSAVAEAVGGAMEDPSYRIGKLDAANRPPIRIAPDAPLCAAVTLMLRNDYSQLPVMTSDREVKGAISWKSIGVALAFGKPCNSVRDCMEKKVEVVEADVSLFRVLENIADQDFVLVRDAERRITGIVTAADLGQSFHQLSRPFLLLSEIENHIRGLIDGKFSREELLDVRSPGDETRDINDVSDLTFGEYVRLLQHPDRWQKVGLKIDRTTFVKDLEAVNQIRNDVMHFDPDGIGPGDLEDLRKMSRFLQQLRDILRH